MKTLEFSVLYRSISLCNMYVFAAERKVAITLFSTYYICVVYYRYDRIIYLFKSAYKGMALQYVSYID